MKLILDVPEPVIKQLVAIHNICCGELAKTGRVDLGEIAEAVGRDSRSLANALRDGYLPFGWASSEKKASATLPVSKVWAYFVRDYIPIADYLDRLDAKEDKP